MTAKTAAWARTEVEHKSRRFARGERVDAGTGGMLPSDVETGVRSGRVTVVQPDQVQFDAPPAWALVQQGHAGRTWLPGERVDIGEKPMPIPVIDMAVRTGLVTLTEPVDLVTDGPEGK